MPSECVNICSRYNRSNIGLFNFHYFEPVQPHLVWTKTIIYMEKGLKGVGWLDVIDMVNTGHALC